jgi:hypothetical protein
MLTFKIPRPLVIIAALALASCGEGESEYSEEADSSYHLTGEYSDGEEEAAAVFQDEGEAFDEDAAREEAERQVASDSYTGIGSPYGCTTDCSGHEAGFEWRRDNGYVTAGNSRSFEEGAQAYEDEVENKVEEMEDDYNSGSDPDY